jgi:hypothetical protein
LCGKFVLKIDDVGYLILKMGFCHLIFKYLRTKFRGIRVVQKNQRYTKS